MENPILHNISLAEFSSFFPESNLIGLGDDFYILNAKLTKKHNPLLHPCRFDGYMIIYCESGSMNLTVNLKDVELRKNMMFVNVPGNIIKVTELVDQPQEDMQYVVIAMTKEFVSNLMSGDNMVFASTLSLIDNPVMAVNEEYATHLNYCNEQIIKIIQSNVSFKKEIVGTIMSGVLYLIAGLWSDTLKSMPQEAPTNSGRSRMIFDNFVKLVEEYHTMHRNVGFYAEKLNLTPKYLSKLVKTSSGRSAPEWIDAYVILEAKNLLKHSNIAIKEIVYKLNFPNQSVFYKFFKMRTGMTPSEYRNS
ncbi:MAG: helix-turn-helix domain-containing protein [Bacteroidales bacterium]|nr:helix-turn-helix domain-containing protein [Bacteroidales bacterium]